MKPTFILQVYNPEFYKAQNNEPMSILLTKSEYWELAGVDGLDPSFTGVAVETTSEKTGNQNMYTTYENRDIAFTVSLFTPYIDDSLKFFSRYLVSGVYAVLRIAEEPGLYLKCKISNYEFNRWTNSAEVTINLQAVDRFWHFDNTETETGNGIYVISDVEVKPYITDTAIHTAGQDGYKVDKLIINITHEELSLKEYDKDINVKSETQRLVFAGINLSVVDTSEIHFELDAAQPGAYIYLGSSKLDITYLVDTENDSQGNYAIWDWTLQTGYSKISAEYVLVNTDTSATLTIPATEFEIKTRPKFVTYPKGLTSEEAFTLSSYLLPENIAKGVIILGVEGSYKGDVETYTGATEIAPTAEAQTLATANKYAESDIIVKAIAPIGAGDTIECNVSSTGAWRPINKDITKLKQEEHARIVLTATGWYEEQTNMFMANKVTVADTEKAKIIAGNIKNGVSILGVTGNVAESNIKFVTEAGSNLGKTILNKLIKTLSITNPVTITTGRYMFSYLSYLEQLDCSGLNTDNVTDFYGMFNGLQSLTSLDVSHLSTAKAQTMGYMFAADAKLESLDLSNFNTSAVIDFNYMFVNCLSLTDLNLSSFDTSNGSYMKDMFNGASALKNVIWGNNWGSNTGISALSIACPLTHDSCLDLFNKLAWREDSPSLALLSSVKALMSEAEIEIATAKHWTIAEIQ